MQLLITPTGTARCLYAETISLTSLGRMQIQRASQVEPDVNGQWWADLAISDGPLLGPFATRSEALAAEVYWLETHRLTAN